MITFIMACWCYVTWWCYQMETFSTLLALCVGNSPVTGEFPAQKPVTWSFDVFFDLCLNKQLSKQLWGWWFETILHPLWRHCNEFYRTCSIMSSGNGLSIVWYKTIMQKICISLIGPLVIIIRSILSNYKSYPNKAFENVVCKIAAILFRLQCTKLTVPPEIC